MVLPILRLTQVFSRGGEAHKFTDFVYKKTFSRQERPGGAPGEARGKEQESSHVMFLISHVPQRSRRCVYCRRRLIVVYCWWFSGGWAMPGCLGLRFANFCGIPSMSHLAIQSARRGASTAPRGRCPRLDGSPTVTFKACETVETIAWCGDG